MSPLKKPLTTKAVESLKPGETLWDSRITGFGVRCRATGSSYFLKARVRGHQRWFTIGRHGSPWTVEQARKKALALLGGIAAGDDPSIEREDKKRVLSVSELCDFYLQEGCADKKLSTLATDRGRIERHIKPLLGKRDVRSIAKRDVEQFMRDVAEGKTAADIKTTKRGRAIVEGGKGTASRTVGLLGGMFSFALDRGIVDINPVRGVRRYKDKRVERYLSEAELARLGAAIVNLEDENEISPFAAAAIRMLLLTGARRGEVLSLRWDWIDFERGLAFLPDSKTGQRALYLSAPALEVLSSLPRLQGNPHVFCGETEGRALVDLKRPWVKVRERADIEGLRIHDLRHNFASVGAMGGLSLPIIGKLLGHIRTETTARYSHLADDPVRAANERIAERIASASRSDAFPAGGIKTVASGE